MECRLTITKKRSLRTRETTKIWNTFKWKIFTMAYSPDKIPHLSSSQIYLQTLHTRSSWSLPSSTFWSKAFLSLPSTVSVSSNYLYPVVFLNIFPSMPKSRGVPPITIYRALSIFICNSYLFISFISFLVMYTISSTSSSSFTPILLHFLYHFFNAEFKSI